MTTVGRPVESRYVQATEPSLAAASDADEGYESEVSGKGAWTAISLRARLVWVNDGCCEALQEGERARGRLRATHLAPSGSRTSTRTLSTATSLTGVRNGTAATYWPFLAPERILTYSASGRSYPTVNE